MRRARGQRRNGDPGGILLAIPGPNARDRRDGGERQEEKDREDDREPASRHVAILDRVPVEFDEHRAAHAHSPWRAAWFAWDLPLDFMESSGTCARRRKDQGIGVSILTTPFNRSLAN